MTEIGNPSGTDPSARAGNKSVHPDVLQLVRNPDSITDPARKQKALSEAGRLSFPETKVGKDTSGTPQFLQEVSQPGRLFAFNGEIRAPQDKTTVPLEEGNFDKLSPTEQIRIFGDVIRGASDNLIIETDDGNMLWIKRTSAPTGNGVDQTFTITSTNHPDAGPKDLPSNMLKDVVAMVGEPLVLGKDAKGKYPRTRGAVTRVTAFRTSRPLDSNHPFFNKPERVSDVFGRFEEAMSEASERARQQAIKKPLGDVAVERTVAIPNAGPASAESANPYERFDRKELGKITDNVIGSLVDSVRKFQPDEVTRTLQNLLHIQRELERRYPEYKPEHERGSREVAVLYVTTLHPKILDRVYDKLQDVDGGFALLIKTTNHLPELQPPETGAVDTKTLDNLEMKGIVSDLRRKRREALRADDPTNLYGIEEPKNRYSILSNDELQETITRLRTRIDERLSNGRDPSGFMTNLSLAAQVMKGRAT